MDKQKKVVYLCGPTNVPKYWEAFEKVDDDLSGRGYVVLNPARLPEGLAPADKHHICRGMIDVSDAVLLLPGWRHGDNAKAEECYRASKAIAATSHISHLVDILKREEANT